MRPHVAPGEPQDGGAGNSWREPGKGGRGDEIRVFAGAFRRALPLVWRNVFGQFLPVLYTGAAMTAAEGNGGCLLVIIFVVMVVVAVISSVGQ